MKKVWLLAPLALMACSQPSKEEAAVSEEQTQEVVEVNEETAVFGDQNITEEGVVSTDELLAMLEDKDSVQVTVEGDIMGVCQKKGCWLEMKLNDEQNMTVRFKDYEFFVPMNSTGKKAVIEGIAKVEVQDVNWLKHKASDAGKSQEEIDLITEPITSVTFMATGVIIKG